MVSRRLTQGIKRAMKSVKPGDIRSEVLRNPTTAKKKQRTGPIPGPAHVEELEAITPTDQQTDNETGSLTPSVSYIPIVVESSTGKRYNIMVPKSYERTVPKTWHWTTERYRVAELVAMGVPFTQIPDDPEVNITSRMVIYGWLQHPEFKEHVDGITLETGFANKRERIAGLNRLTRKLFDKVIQELDEVPITDKSIGPILTAIQTTAKLIAQEKEEFVEESKITQDTNISGSITNVQMHLDNVLTGLGDEERKQLEQAFDDVGDEIIRTLTGDKE